MNDAETRMFGMLVDALRKLIGAHVRVTVGDQHTGFGFVSLDGVVRDLDVEDERVELRFSRGVQWLALYAGMIEALEVRTDGLSIMYAAGPVTVRRLDDHSVSERRWW